LPRASTIRAENRPRDQQPASARLRPVHVFVPYQLSEGRAASPYYDTAEFRAELPGWFAPGREWRWCVITLDEQSLTRAVSEARAAGAVVLNLCDGDEQDGYPGPSVVAALAASGVSFSGADPRFYGLSSSKLAMKQRFIAAGLPTAPFIRLDHDEAIALAKTVVGYPCILKLDVSADGIGMTRRSVVAGADDLKDEHAALLAHGFGARMPYVEAFVKGREMSVLVVEDDSAATGLRAFAPVECVFDTRIPDRERILFKGHRDFDPFGNQRDEGTAARVVYQTAPDVFHEPLKRLAIAAFRAVDGVGYARIDVRIRDGDDAAFLLEVNANCSLSRDELSIAPALAAAHYDFSDLVRLILRESVEAAR